MLNLGADARIWLCMAPTDMRRSFDGLSALVRNDLGADPTSGQWFVFVNRRLTMLKILGVRCRGLLDLVEAVGAGPLRGARARRGRAEAVEPHGVAGADRGGGRHRGETAANVGIERRHEGRGFGKLSPVETTD